MDNYIVSARKYRPINFDSVVGQESITTTLKNAIKTGQLAQAFLFCGPRGVGKTTCARILSKTINCLNPNENMEACNECESCKSFNNNASFNIHELDAASNNSVQDIRNLVDQVRIPPQVGKFKIYIIDEVHMLSQAAFNAFLKTLEEPPSYAKFILATTEKNKIIPTILSRCQIFDFKRITVADIVKHLQYVAKSENIIAEEQALHTIATKSDGGMRDALSLFDQMIAFCGKEISYQNVIQSLNILDYEYYFKITDFIIDSDTKNVLITINEIFDNGFEGQTFIAGFNEHLRNLLVAKNPETLKLLLESDNIKLRYKEQAEKTNEALILKALTTMNKCDIDYRQSNNKHLLIEVALINICYYVAGYEKKNDNKNGYEINVPKDSPFRTKSSEKNNINKEIQFKAKEENNAITEKDNYTSLEKPKNDSEIKTNDIVANQKSETSKSIQVPKLPKQKMVSINLSSITSEAEEKATPVETRNNKFSIEELKESIEKFSMALAPSRRLLKVALKSGTDISIKDENTVFIHCDSSVNETEIKSNLMEIASYLRNALQNDFINIKTDVAEIATKVVIYTNQDKFKKLAEKNKMLLELQKRLELKISY